MAETEVSQTEVHGYCEKSFERVREAFAKNFAVENEVGASFAAMVDGEMVVDLWGGFADKAGTRPWGRDTLANVWSTTKAMTAICAHVLVDRGLLDVEAPVARYWPEFAQAGKGDIPVKWLLSHQAGLAGIVEPMPTEAWYDWERITAALAAQAPLWEPGTVSGYHGVTFGHLVGEVVRRISGRSLGTFFREEVALPLGADFWIGLPASEDHRVAEMVAPAMTLTGNVDPNDDSPKAKMRRAMGNPPVSASMPAQRAWRAAEIPAVNGQGTARACAKVMGTLAQGGRSGYHRLMKEETVNAAIQEQVYGTDLQLGPMRWGLGFMLASNEMPLSPNPRTFGHGGWGGSFAMADLDAKVSCGYVMNRMSGGTVGDKRLGRLIRAVYGGLETRPKYF